MLAVLLAALAAAPVVVAGWYLRRSGRTDERRYGRLNIRVCSLFIAAGILVFAFVNAIALGAPAREAGGVAVWAASFVTSLAVFPMMVSSRLSRKAHRDHLPW